MLATVAAADSPMFLCVNITFSTQYESQSTVLLASGKKQFIVEHTNHLILNKIKHCDGL